MFTTKRPALFVYLSLACAFAQQSIAGGTVWYVNASSSGSQSGLNWDDAFTQISTALNSATAGDEIWVAAGTYHPITLRDGVGVYGGFAGWETERGQRNHISNETILSGDILGDDLESTPNDCCSRHDTAGCSDLACSSQVCSLRPACCNGEWDVQCVALAFFHCSGCETTANLDDNMQTVQGVFVGPDTVLDGFTITSGLAADRGYGIGGGLLLVSSSPKILACRFVSNYAPIGGGAVGIYGGSPSFHGCIFSGNRTAGHGGAIRADGTLGPNSQPAFPSFTACIFSGNVALGPGAIHSGERSVLTIQSCAFEQNFSSVVGGAIADIHTIGVTSEISHSRFIGNDSGAFGGAVSSSTVHASTFNNSAFLGNSADNGGAFSNDGSLNLLNCTIAGNSALSQGGGVFSTSGAEFVSSNTIVAANNSSEGTGEDAQIHGDNSLIQINYSCIEGWTGQFGGEGNFGDDPLLFDVDGLDNIPGTSDDDIRLREISPCIDAGSNSLMSRDTLDIDWDEDSVEPTPSDLMYHSRRQDVSSIPDTGEGVAPIVDIGAIESGFVDCNNNGIDDPTDIANGTSEDCNENLIPDECDGAVCVNASFPPDGSGDARQPFSADGSTPEGWQIVKLTFTADPTPIAPGAFQVTTNPPTSNPHVTSLEIDGLDVYLHLDQPIQPGVWTTFRHTVSGTSTTIGFLPGDVNSDRTSSPVDVLSLIDAINGVTPLMYEWQTDIDRSGTTDAMDIVREIDILVNCELFGCWLYESLPNIDE